MSATFDRPPAVRLGAIDIHKSFGAIHANRGISLSVGPNTIHAIVGENGAGKSTLMRILQGMDQPDSGRVVVDDSPLVLRGPRHALALGIGMVHQEFMLVPNLSLLENFMLGAEPMRDGFFTRPLLDWSRAKAAGDELAKQAGVEIDWSMSAGRAPVHIRQILEILRLLSRGATTLILDEPTSVLAPRQVEDLFRMLRALRDRDTTILFISHKLKEVLALAESVSVIRNGEMVAHTTVDQTNSRELAHLIVGGTFDQSSRADRRHPLDTRAEPALSLRAVTALDDRGARALRGVDLDLRPGEILGVAGVAGNGQEELAGCIAGLRRPARGTIRLGGTDVTGLGNAAMRAQGLGYVSSDRAHEGLALDATIFENAIAGKHRGAPFSKRGRLRLGAAKKRIRAMLAELDIVFGHLSDAARSLSGGNQQRLVFVREIVESPRVMLVAQPTRGVDVKGIAAVHAILRAYRDEGGAVLLISEELEELLALCDRIIVLAAGTVVGEVAGGEADIKTLGRMMVIQGKVDAA